MADGTHAAVQRLKADKQIGEPDRVKRVCRILPQTLRTGF